MARDYTYQELMAMQEEATQRVREMQRRAQLTAQRAQEELDRKKRRISPHFSAAGGAPAGKSRRAQRPSGAAAPANRARAHSGKNGS